MSIRATAVYDEDKMKERERVIREDPDLEKRNRSFVGKAERRIYFTAELL